MMKSTRIKLVPPSMDLVRDSVDATRESAAELSEYLGWIESAMQDPEKNMQTAIENYRAFEAEVRFYIIDISNAAFIGAIGLLVRDPDVPFFEIGYWIRSSKVGNGYATEAVVLLEQYAFEQKNAKRLEIRMASSNVKSRSVAEKCGYSKEAELQNERRLPGGELSNTLVYAKVGS